MRGDLELVVREGRRLGGDLENGLNLERGEVVEGDIPGFGAEVQREPVFGMPAAPDDQASVIDLERSDFPAGAGRAGGFFREPVLGIFHIPEEILADIDRRLADRDAGELAVQEPREREAQNHAAHREHFGERVVGGNDRHVRDFDGLLLSSDRRGRLREREVRQRGVDLKRNVGRGFPLVFEANPEPLQNQLPDHPCRGGMGRLGRGRRPGKDLLQRGSENQASSGHLDPVDLVLRENPLRGEIEVHTVQNKKFIRISRCRNLDIPRGEIERRFRIRPGLAPVKRALQAHRRAGRPESLAEDFGVFANNPSGRPRGEGTSSTTGGQDLEKLRRDPDVRMHEPDLAELPAAEVGK